MQIIVFIARVVIGIVFAVAAAGKLFDLPGSRKSMTDFGLPAFLAGPFGILLPLAELACTIALVPNQTVSLGAIGIAIMLVVFIAGMLFNLARGRKPDCHCFGQIHSEPISAKTVARNVVLLALSLLVAFEGGNAGLPSLASLTPFDAGMLSAVVLLGLGLILTLWLLIHVLHQNGRLLLRLEAVEKKVGMEASSVPAPGLPVGDPAPALRLTSLEGRTVTSEMLVADGRPLLLVFTEPGCGACDLLLPDVARWQGDYADRLSVVPVSGGELEANIAKSAEHKLQNLMLQVGRETSDAYKVTATPSAVLVRDGKIASPLAAGVEEIRKLVALSTLPPPAKKGEPVPALRLSDLEGEAVDLASFRGRRTLILFWSPSCGFCQAMLDDVKKWESQPPDHAPELVVVSSGTPEDARQQGFRSKVLLDPMFGAGNVLGANGTPSGVIIDEDGRIASEVGVGAQAVLELAGAPSAR